jgi:hypothetical protein
MTEDALKELDGATVARLSVDDWFENAERLVAAGTLRDVFLDGCPIVQASPDWYNAPVPILAGERWRIMLTQAETDSLVRMDWSGSVEDNRRRLVAVVLPLRWPGITFHLPEDASS